MPLKLGTTNINIPYSKACLGNQLIYAGGGKTVDTVFTSCPFPTSWTEVTAGTDYTGDNNYGTWRISATSYASATYNVSKVFDNDISTHWRTKSLTTNSQYSECMRLRE